MAYEIPGFSFTLPAKVDLNNQWRFVNIDATGNALYASADGRVIGVLNNKPKATQPATIVQNGVAMVEAGAAIALGADVSAGANGVALTAASGIKTGVALEAATATGQIIAVLLKG